MGQPGLNGRIAQSLAELDGPRGKGVFYITPATEAGLVLRRWTGKRSADKCRARPTPSSGTRATVGTSLTTTENRRQSDNHTMIGKLTTKALDDHATSAASAPKTNYQTRTTPPLILTSKRLTH